MLARENGRENNIEGFRFGFFKSGPVRPLSWELNSSPNQTWFSFNSSFEEASFSSS